MIRNPLKVQRREREEMRRNPYMIDVNRERNCYSCGEFGHLAWNCRRQEIMGQKRRIEYEDN